MFRYLLDLKEPGTAATALGRAFHETIAHNFRQKAETKRVLPIAECLDCFRTALANDSLERDIAELLTRPVGRPGHKPVVWYKGFLYQAASWKTARRVAAKVEFHLGELFPGVGFIVTFNAA